MGLPLENGLNYGWQLSSWLAQAVAYCSTVDELLAAYEAHFYRVADEVVQKVERDYAAYQHTIATAQWARSLLRSILMFNESGGRPNT